MRPAPASRGAAKSRGVPPWLIGAAIAVLLIGGGAFAYFKFFSSAPQPETAAVAPASESALPAADTPRSTDAAADSAADAAAMADEAQAQMLEPLAGADAAAPAPVEAASALEPAAAAPPPVDPTLRIASDLVRKGERAYSRGDYDAAVRQANSALDAHAGYVPAVKLMRRAYAAQKKAEEQRAEQERLAAAEQARIAAEQAAAQAPKPDDVYDQRAHSECAPGLFGKACRRKVRAQVCAGVEPGAPGSTVCANKN